MRLGPQALLREPLWWLKAMEIWDIWQAMWQDLTRSI